MEPHPDYSDIMGGWAGNTTFKLYFEGKLFYEQGGYKQKVINNASEHIRLERLETNQGRNQSLLIWLTAIIAIGTLIAGIYYLTELDWKYHWLH